MKILNETTLSCVRVVLDKECVLATAVERDSGSDNECSPIARITALWKTV